MNQLFADISNNNVRFNARDYRLGGHVFIAIKATEGRTFLDPDHRAFSLQAGLQHIGIAHYHFAHPELHPPAAEARHFLSTIGPLVGPRDYLVLDLERGTTEHDPDWSRAFDAYIREHSRFKIIIYGSKSFLEAAPASAWLTGAPYRFWDADWSGDQDFAPRGGKCVMRQTSNGTLGPPPHTLPGVGVCDVNHLRGGFAARVLANARP